MTKKLTKLLLLVLLLIPSYVNATSATMPVFDEEANKFYANGTDITIIDNGNGGAAITAEDNSWEVNSNTTIYGGGIAGTDFDSSSITMKGGLVGQIIGGGEGTIDTSANVKQVSIKILGGKINSNVIGGGLLSSKVDDVSINVSGGEIFAIIGGGIASTNHGSVGNEQSPESSPNAVTHAMITISGGKINNDTKGYGLVYGGGQGYSYVKDTIINITNQADLSKAWLIGGGSNGRTDNATININGGRINVVASINRGSMINATIKMTEGTIEKMYLGGEDPESFDDDIVNGGFLDQGMIIADITGGHVQSLMLGSNYNDIISPDAPYAKVFYQEDSIGNADELASTMGTIAKPYVSDNMVMDIFDTDTIITSDILKAIKTTNKIYGVRISDQYGWIIQGDLLKNESIPIQTAMEITTEAFDDIPNTIHTEVQNHKLKDVAYWRIHQETLPGLVYVTHDVSNIYPDDIHVYTSYYDKETGELKDQQESIVKGGKITIAITKGGDYLLTTTNMHNENNNIPSPNTGDINLPLLIIISGGGVIGIIIVVRQINKIRQDKENC